jgi:hypothetical protein
MELDTRDQGIKHGISAFPGSLRHSEAYANWREEVENYAASFTDVSDPIYGLLWAVISQAEWLALPNIHVPYVRLVPPALPRPAAALGRIWERELLLYNQECKAEARVRAVVISTCDEMAKHVVKGAAQLRNVTLTIAMTNLAAEWGAPRESDMAKANAECERPYVPPANLEQFFLGQIRSHALMARANQPMSEYYKLKFIITALTTCGHFRDCISHYQQLYPENDHRRTFESFKAAALLYAARFPVTSTTGSLGYAGGAREADLEKKVADLTRQVSILKAASISQLQKPAGTRAPSTAAVAPNTECFYCWTHGVPFKAESRHHSADCRYPAKLHQYQATLQNTMGGKPA